ncbi:hypothetical protein RA210_U460009 [Rubrivivax sp. A210]|nr:hypothetical protein RA210_U460009 [Rubrivivax sp. A210]
MVVEKTLLLQGKPLSNFQSHLLKSKINLKYRGQRMRSNPSLKRSANGRPPSPGRWYAVHFHRPGIGVLPLAPA